MAHLATPEFLAHLKSLFPGSNTRSLLQNAWYIVAAVAFNASNRPDAVPVVFHHALDTLKTEQRTKPDTANGHGEQLKLARRMRDSLFQSGLLCGYSRTINSLVSLHETMPEDLRDTECLRNTEKSIQDYARDGRELYLSMYGDNANRVQSLLDAIYPDQGWFSNTIGYGVVYGGAGVLTQVESSYVIATANIAMGTPRQIAWHLKNAMNGGASLEEVRAVRSIAIEVAERSGVSWDEEIPQVEV